LILLGGTFSSSWSTVALLQKGKKILTAANREAEEAFAKDPIGRHTGDVTIPITELHWDYNTSGRMWRRANMLEAILREIKQEPKSL
jgi:hypothetical protein